MIAIDKEACVGCGICVYLCPVDDCLTGWSDIQVEETCIDCFKCVHGCPVNAVTIVPKAVENNHAAT
jgi:energy-converting hydrogenase A subunit Q